MYSPEVSKIDNFNPLLVFFFVKLDRKVWNDKIALKAFFLKFPSILTEKTNKGLHCKFLKL